MNRSIPLVFVLVFLTASCIIIVKPIRASADSWVTRALMPTARAGLGVAVLNGKIYAIGGQAASLVSDPTCLNTNEMYDPDTNTWTTEAPMPTARRYFGTAVYQNKIYVFGGWISAGNITGATEVYDPQTNTWENKSSMPTPRQDMQANTVGGKIYLISGLPQNVSPYNFTVSNATEVYDPSSDSWSTAASIPTPVYLYASAVVDNKIYVEGGEQSAPPFNNNLNQIYDPETNA